MRLLDRYLFRELFAPLAYCLGGFLIFWISFDLFNGLEDFQDDKLHLFDVHRVLLHDDAGISRDGAADLRSCWHCFIRSPSCAPQRDHRHARGRREPVAVVRALFLVGSWPASRCSC